MYRERKRKRIAFLILSAILCIMVIGYSAFYSEFRISGTTNITSNWDIRISSISSPTVNGSAEEVINPSCDVSGTPKSCGEGLSADMEVNLYEAGDSVEYDITITNYGSIDAKLDDYIISGETEAIKVTFSGHTKGETLFKSGSSGDSKTIHVKIEYNPEYTGGEVSEETSISFEYKQADVKELDEDEVISKDRYLVIYNCTENGGEECTSNNEYLLNNENIDLTKTASKEGYEFIGWNTDKDATSSIQNLKVSENTTLYAIYKKDITVTYEIDGQGITKISKNSDTCTIYNKDVCNENLPTITLKNTNYEQDGFYIEDVFIGASSEAYTFKDSALVKVKAKALPVMMTGPNFQTKIASIKSSITNIEFIDINETELAVPDEIDNETSWDVSAEGNGSVLAFTIDGENTKTLYIASMGKTIGNSNCQKLFYTFTNITSIEFNDHFDTSNVENMSHMFNGCSSLTELDVSNFDTKKVTGMVDMFANLTSITELNLSNFDTSYVTTMAGMFKGSSSLIELDLSSFDTSKVTVMGNANGSGGMFEGCTNLISLDISSFDTSKVTNMDFIFSGCSGLTELDLSNFDTSNATNMSGMFRNCNNLVELDVSNFDTGKAENMSHMFNGCSSLTELDVSNFDTKKVTGMVDMFANLTSITELNLSNFDTSYVTTMAGMFKGSSSLIELDLSSFDTSKVTVMGNAAGSGGMFSGCRSLVKLDISNFDTSKVTNMSDMFYNCVNIETIYVSENFDTSKTTNSSYMFYGCTKLVGYNGTAVSVKKKYDKTYAKIDNESQEGYFTDGIYPLITNISTTSEKYSITIVADASIAGDTTKIDKYEFSIDDGNTWYEQIDSSIASNVYTFAGLNLASEYNINVRAISGEDSAIKSIVASTLDIERPTYKEIANGKNSTVTIDFGDCVEYTCSYMKDSNEEIIVNTEEVNVFFDNDGTLIAKKADSLNTVSSSYVVTIANTLYDVVKRDATIDNIASLYTGNGSEDFDNPVYYYNSNSDATKSNVLFNGICWQMVRTTDTGGVKLLYNGEADENDECAPNRPNHKGYGSKSSSNLMASYKYGSSYTLNNGTFTLNNLYTYDGNNPNDLIGKYTCRNANTSCTTLYYIEEYNGENSFVQIPITSNTVYSAVGSTPYNYSGSLSYFGYMYNTIYTNSDFSWTRENITTNNISLNTSRYFDNEVIWNSPTQSKYNMSNPFNSSSDGYSSLIGKYAVSDNTNGATNTNVSGNYAFYIVGVSGTTGYTIRLSNGEMISDYEKSYTFGSTITDNEDGTYTVSNESGEATTIKRSEWFTKKDTISNGYYMCFGQSDTCTEVYQINSISNDYFNYRKVETYLYGNDVEYYGGKYHLTGTTQSLIDWKAEYNKINNTHYTCYNGTGECDEVFFIHAVHATMSKSIKLINGVTIEKALEQMLYDSDVNVKNSIIKSSVDLWYKENMSNKANYIEDTVYCNNRVIRSMGGFSKNGTVFFNYGSTWPHFKESSISSDLTCTNDSDKYTVNASNGNGNLTYPVGILTTPEAKLLGKNALVTGYAFWLNDPNYYFYGDTNDSNNIDNNGNITNSRHTSYKSIRPVISLRPNTVYKEGNGTYTKPYIIE